MKEIYPLTPRIGNLLKNAGGGKKKRGAGLHDKGHQGMTRVEGPFGVFWDGKGGRNREKIVEPGKR